MGKALDHLTQADQSIETAKQRGPLGEKSQDDITAALKNIVEGSSFNWRTIPSAIRNIPESLASAPGDLVNWEIGKLHQYAPTSIANWADQFKSPITSDVVQSTTDEAIKKVFPKQQAADIQSATRYQPQNPQEELVSTGIQLLPSLLTKNPRGLDFGTRLLTRVVAPAVGVEAAGQTTRAVAPELEPAVRMVAGFLTSGSPANAAQLASLRQMMAKLGSTQAGMQALTDTLERSGMSAAEIRTKISDLGGGQPTNLMDVNPEAQLTGQRVYAKGGIGRAVMKEQLEEREAGTHARVQQDLRSTLGPEINEDVHAQAQNARLSQLGKEQKQAAKTGQIGPADLQPLLDEIDTRLGTEKIPEVVNALKRVRESLLIKKTAPDQPDVPETASEPILRARQAIDEVLYDAKGRPSKTIGRYTKDALTDMRSRLNDELTRTNAPLRAKDVEIAQAAKEKQAFGVGRNEVIQKKGAKSPQEFADQFNAMSPEEQAQVRQGLTRKVDEMVGLKANDRVALKEAITGKGKWNHQKIATIIGQSAADELVRGFERESAYQTTANKVMQNSKTAETYEADKDPAMIARARDMLTKIGAGGGLAGIPGMIGGALVSGADALLGKIGQYGREAQRSELGRLLSSTRTDQILRASELAKNLGGSQARALLTTLMAQDHEASRNAQLRAQGNLTRR